MTEYIITDEEINDLAFGQCCDFELIVSNIRSRPYQNQRENVLDVIRPPIVYFALCMEQKLRKHDKDRGERGWYGYDHKEDLEYLFRRLLEETKELNEQIKSCNETTFSNPVFTEAEDVGNFAMMIRTAGISDEILKQIINRKLEELRGEQ
jgi:NTP pyrophosphatase (non-canonical NTP hydrolase)